MTESHDTSPTIGPATAPLSTASLPYSNLNSDSRSPVDPPEVQESQGSNIAADGMAPLSLKYGIVPFRSSGIVAPVTAGHLDSPISGCTAPVSSPRLSPHVATAANVGGHPEEKFHKAVIMLFKGDSCAQPPPDVSPSASVLDQTLPDAPAQETSLLPSKVLYSLSPDSIPFIFSAPAEVDKKHRKTLKFRKTKRPRKAGGHESIMKRGILEPTEDDSEPSRGSDLPTELLDMVLMYAMGEYEAPRQDPNRTELVPLSLVCRTWLQRCAPILYRTVSVRWSRIEAFYDCLRSHHSLIRPHMKSLTLDVHHDEHLDPGSLRRLSKLLHGTLTNLDVYDSVAVSEERIERRIPSSNIKAGIYATFSALTDLELWNHTFSSSQDLLRLFGSLPSLIKVNLNYVTWRQSPVFAPFRTPNRLVEISCHQCTATWPFLLSPSLPRSFTCSEAGLVGGLCREEASLAARICQYTVLGSSVDIVARLRVEKSPYPQTYIITVDFDKRTTALELHIRRHASVLTVNGTASILWIVFQDDKLDIGSDEYFRSKEDVQKIDELLSQLPRLEKVVFETERLHDSRGIAGLFSNVAGKVHRRGWNKAKKYAKDAHTNGVSTGRTQLPISAWWFRWFDEPGEAIDTVGDDDHEEEEEQEEQEQEQEQEEEDYNPGIDEDANANQNGGETEEKKEDKDGEEIMLHASSNSWHGPPNTLPMVESEEIMNLFKMARDLECLFGRLTEHEKAPDGDDSVNVDRAVFLEMLSKLTSISGSSAASVHEILRHELELEAPDPSLPSFPRTLPLYPLYEFARHTRKAAAHLTDAAHILANVTLEDDDYTSIGKGSFATIPGVFSRVVNEISALKAAPTATEKVVHMPPEKSDGKSLLRSEANATIDSSESPLPETASKPLQVQPAFMVTKSPPKQTLEQSVMTDNAIPFKLPAFRRVERKRANSV